MLKQIKTWKDLVGLESENYKLDVILMPCGGGCAWIMPKFEIEDNCAHEHSAYLSTHTFYESHYKSATKILQEFGFNVELVKDE